MSHTEKGVGFHAVVESTSETFEWLNISSENWREYTYPDGSKVRVEYPVALSLKSSSNPPQWGGGAHRIVDCHGDSYYIPRGWIKLSWRSDPFYEF